MTQEEIENLKMLYLPNVSYQELVDSYPQFGDKEFVLKELNQAVADKNKEMYEQVMFLVYHGQTYYPELCGIFQKIILEDWHKGHEDIASTLQFNLDCPDSIDALVKAINLSFDYLNKQGDDKPFIIKCLNAIASVRTKYAIMQLENLASHDDEYTSYMAAYLLDLVKQGQFR